MKDKYQQHQERNRDPEVEDTTDASDLGEVRLSRVLRGERPHYFLAIHIIKMTPMGKMTYEGRGGGGDRKGDSRDAGCK